MLAVRSLKLVLLGVFCIVFDVLSAAVATATAWRVDGGDSGGAYTVGVVGVSSPGAGAAPGTTNEEDVGADAAEAAGAVSTVSTAAAGSASAAATVTTSDMVARR